MSTPPPRSGYRATVDHHLAELRSELGYARIADRHARCSPYVANAYGAEREQLLACLEQYAAALERYQLPLPTAIRDELRLRRRVAV